MLMYAEMSILPWYSGLSGHFSQNISGLFTKEHIARRSYISEDISGLYTKVIRYLVIWALQWHHNMRMNMTVLPKIPI